MSLVVRNLVDRDRRPPRRRRRLLRRARRRARGPHRRVGVGQVAHRARDPRPPAGRRDGHRQHPLDERELIGLPDRELARLRGDEIGIVFQEPRTALNPIRTVGRQIAESVRIHEGLGRRDAAARAIAEAERVHLPDRRRSCAATRTSSPAVSASASPSRWPRLPPRLLIADEPTALDVTIQAEVLDLLGGLVARDGMSLVFITHDLAVLSDRHARRRARGRARRRARAALGCSRHRHPRDAGLLRDATATLWRPGGPA
jgi:peptide/nickel transport system ATP-binding protein